MLGPILYVLYFNDIKNAIISGKTICHADAAALTFKWNNWNNIFNECEIGMMKLKVRLHENKLFMNVEKTKFVCFRLYKSKLALKMLL